MTLSNTSEGNINWKLDKLLSASRESKQYVARSNLPRVENELVFSPWTPRQLPDTSAESVAPANEEATEPETDTDILSSDSSELSPALEPETQDESCDTNYLKSEAVLEEINKAFEQGKLQGVSETESKYSKTEQELSELIDSISNMKIDITDFQKTIVQLATFIASKIVRAETLINPNWIDSLVEQCIHEIRQHGHEALIVRLGIDNFESYSQRLLKRHENISFVKDEDLDVGDVEITMGATSITESIEKKLQKISAQLLESLQASSSPNETELVD